ncbi:MAG: IS21 family transposase [Alphaproteobacteria bacterium]
MTTERLLMRQVREILRLKYEQRLPHRAIARACGVGLGTVSEYCRRAQQAGLTWPLPEDTDDGQLEARLFRRVGDLVGVPRLLPDWAWVHQELKRPGVTLQRLWLEFLERHPEGHRYSQFCVHYHRWVRALAPTMRQIHRAGEKAFVDFSGKRPQIIDAATGEVVPVELFVGALGASSYVYAEACPSQALVHWVSAHVRMVEFFQGAPAIFVPDNLWSGVTKACRYEPIINRTYVDFARHYGAAVVPARAGRPRDKAVVEANVLVAQRVILAALRHRRFFSLVELNAAIWELLPWLNGRPMRKLGVSRRELFEQLDRPALRPLPVTRYEFAEWSNATVNIDYHVVVDHNYYSVPYPLVHQSVEVRLSAATVEVFLKGRRVASHRRRRGHGEYATDPAHMPQAHRAHAEWTPSRLIAWAETTGPVTAQLVAALLAAKAHPEQGYRACLGIMRLGKSYGPARLEAACARALRLDAPSYRTVQNILASGVDRVPLQSPPPEPPPRPAHSNIRGSAYYTQEEIPLCSLTPPSTN